jgi:two-component system sensor histidine kinase KdpD
MPPDLPLVECDATLIERIFVNLLENAAKYTPPGSIIRIGAQADAAEIRVSVADNGLGIPRGQESEIFGKFIRASPRTDVPGLGLGLAICSTVVEAHGGRIWAKNLPEGGAEFTFTLPRGIPPAMEVDPPERA